METFNYFPNGFLPYMYDFKDKIRNVRQFMSRMYVKTNRIFEYENLPETVDRAAYELWTQSNGFSLATNNWNGKDLFVYYGSLGDEPDDYYHPSKAIINNVRQKFNKELEIGKDVVLIKNDSLLCGLNDLLSKYATLLAETELSLELGLINTRLISIMTAKDEGQKEALDEYIADIEEGRMHSVFDESFVLDGIKVQPYANSSFNNNLVQQTEIWQFIMGNLYRELGLRGAYNTKRENISESESKIGDETLLPLIDDMLKCRQEAWDECNKLFGTDVRVKKSGAWEEQEAQMLEESEEKEPEEETEEEGLVKKLIKKVKGEKENVDDETSKEPADA